MNQTGLYMQLNTKQISLPIPVPIPSQQMIFVKPISYEFRVVEVVENEKIVSVKLQTLIWEHDENGVGNILFDWHDVPRVKMDKNGIIY